eukprot:scaffold14091_cov28-Tisochrysis_lutea.AAC.5
MADGPGSSKYAKSAVSVELPTVPSCGQGWPCWWNERESGRGTRWWCWLRGRCGASQAVTRAMRRRRSR